MKSILVKGSAGMGVTTWHKDVGIFMGLEMEEVTEQTRDRIKELSCTSNLPLASGAFLLGA